MKSSFKKYQRRVEMAEVATRRTEISDFLRKWYSTPFDNASIGWRLEVERHLIELLSLYTELLNRAQRREAGTAELFALVDHAQIYASKISWSLANMLPDSPPYLPTEKAENLEQHTQKVLFEAAQYFARTGDKLSRDLQGAKTELPPPDLLKTAYI